MIFIRKNKGKNKLNIFFEGLDGLSKKNKTKAKIIVLAVMSKYYDKMASLDEGQSQGGYICKNY